MKGCDQDYSIPSFFPSEEDFARGPLAYVESITQQASRWGLAHIVPPPSWDPPLALRDGCDGVRADTFQFGVRIQETSKLCRRHPGDFGFEAGPGKYTLSQFEDACRSFNRSHFGRTDPTIEDVEREFWRIVDGGEQEGHVEVMYGSDLDNSVHGSGFPLPPGLRMNTFEKNCIQHRMARHHSEDTLPDMEYRVSPWNVNNFSLHPRSVLSYLVEDKPDEDLVSGVMIPWVYIGSTFSAFNWHIEDHGLYSVNYLHCGAEKVWYCCPGDQSSKFEQAMQEALPHLFKACPGLLCRLVTQMLPDWLRQRGVDVYRVVHTPRSFIITMPNSYHTGFNTGFNIAESCNFGALPWIAWSGKIAEKYASIPRQVSISHDKMLIGIIERCLDADLVMAAMHELQNRVEKLKKEWKSMHDSFGIPLGLGERRGTVGGRKQFWKDGGDSLILVSCQRTNPEAPSTSEADCAICLADLWLVGCFSDREKSTMTCLQHAAMLGASSEDLRISCHYTIDDLIDICRT
jgi:hypothetical protein